jgi:hypothetical protein
MLSPSITVPLFRGPRDVREFHRTVSQGADTILSCWSRPSPVDDNGDRQKPFPEIGTNSRNPLRRSLVGNGPLVMRYRLTTQRCELWRFGCGRPK